jgi:hypothetical protein
MSVTREVITDLLPVYFGGEASEDTRRLIEDYFRQDPEFERIARSAARPLERLRRAPTAAPGPDQELATLERTRKLLRNQKIWLGFAIFFTAAPFSSVFITLNNGGAHLNWVMLRDDPWQAAVFLDYAAVCWVVYFRKMWRLRATGL